MTRRKTPSGSAKSSKELSDLFLKEEFKPSEYMRARRPELFSDSRIESEPLLGRELFEYHLETLTSRKEEVKFEHFCRRLCEQEICPNLLPQTGPTGGGDSKTDSENYPVAESIAMRWYEGVDTVAAARERWGFAFSAKKKWRQKAISDIEKIANTKRGYTEVFFVTNQFVKDRERAALEDELTLRHGFKVHILDRSWIVKCVLEHDRVELAIETLGLDTDLRPRKTAGPSDVRNNARLEELEKEIDDTSRYAGTGYQLAEDCLQAALIARNLELPRSDVEARFQRAERIAKQVDHPQQKLRIAYNRAWTCYWWYEDLNEFLSHYASVEELALRSSSAEDLGLLTNLWQLLSSSCRFGKLDPNECRLDQHMQALSDSLSRIAQDRSRTNNSLHARTELIFMNLAARAPNRDGVGPLLTGLRDAIREARGLISYPFEPIPKIIEELGNVFTDVPEYDELLEEAASSAQERIGSQEAGRMLLAQGVHKFRANRPYEAIVYLGRAQQLLAMRESRWEISEALFICGSAYEAGGLFWAARANVLASLNQVLSDYWDNGFIAPQGAVCAQKLAWIEIELGRVACAISWMQLADLLASGAKLDEKARERFREVRWNQDAVLGILLLRAQQEDLRYLQYLPDVLEALDLEISRMALLYALGYEDQLRSEGLIPEQETDERVREFFIKWLRQPASADLPERLVGTAGKMKFLSTVLGCRLRFEVDDDNESIFLAERFSGAIEALLSTSLSEGVFPYREEYIVRVERSNRVKKEPELQIDNERGFSILRHNGNIVTPSGTEENWFLEVIAQLVTQIIKISDLDSYLERVFGKELGLSRALNFTETSVPVSNIFGTSPKLRLSDWNNDGKPAAYLTRRIVPWYDGLPSVQVPTTSSAPVMGSGRPPKELLDRSSLKHSSRQVSSLINMALWDRAKWGGVVYSWSVDPNEEPLLALAFEDGDAGRDIFRELIEKVGTEDEQDRLRISIITGVSRAFPAKYAVLVGSNLPERDEIATGREIVSVSRVHHMDNTNPVNLKMFQERFGRTKKFRLIPAQLPSEQRDGVLFDDLEIVKNSIRIIPAWQVGENDLDSAAIGPNDDPIIPAEVTDAPILRVLDRLKRGFPKFGRGRVD
jgi:hypothetical protein